MSRSSFISAVTLLGAFAIFNVACGDSKPAESPSSTPEAPSAEAPSAEAPSTPSADADAGAPANK